MRTRSLVRRVVIIALALGFGTGIRAQTAATPAIPAAPRLQAELLTTIDASHVKVGDEVTARTITPLEVGGAKYAPGSFVKGHIVEAAPSKLVLLFDQMLIKKNPPAPISLSLRAVMMPHSTSQPSGTSSNQISPRAGTLGASSGSPMRSPETAARDSVDTPFKGPHPNTQPAPPVVETGGVIGIPGVHLQISTDPKVGAIFEADKDQKLRLEKGLQIDVRRFRSVGILSTGWNFSVTELGFALHS